MVKKQYLFIAQVSIILLMLFMVICVLNPLFVRAETTTTDNESKTEVSEKIPLPKTPEKVTMSSGTKTDITFTWSKSANATSYAVYVSTQEKGTYRRIGTTTKTTYKITGLKESTIRYIKVSAVNVTGESPTSASCKGVTIPKKVASIKQPSWYKNKITLTWNSDIAADKYNIYVREYASKDSTFKKVTDVTTNTYTLKDLTYGEKYYIRVRAENKAGESDIAFIEAVTKLGKVENLKTENWYYATNKLNITWDMQSAVDGYEAVLYNEKGKKIKKCVLLGAYKAKNTFNDAKSDIYTVKVRAYMTYNGQKKYSGWNTIKCVRQARIMTCEVKNGKIQLKWKKVKGANGYEVYVSTSPLTGYKKAKKLSGNSKTSYNIKKVNGSPVSKNTEYYVYVKTLCKKGSSKNTSGVLYYWSTKKKSYYYF